MSEFESSSPTNLVVAVLRPARTASLSELWKSRRGSMVTLGARRVGSQRQTWDLGSSNAAREVPRTVLATAEAPLTNDCASTGFYVRLALAAAEPGEKPKHLPAQWPLCFCVRRE